MVTGMRFMETPLNLSIKFSKSFSNVSQRKLKANRLGMFEQIDNWLRK